MSTRYLLCRPRGGLNDTLCQIERCWRYAERFGRHLIIDTQQSALFGDFSDYFEVIDQTVEISTRLDYDLIAHLNTLSCRPYYLAGQVDSYVTKYEKYNGFVDIQLNQPTRFNSNETTDFDLDFDESLLIYDNAGGGNDSFRLLERVRLSESIRSVVRYSIDSLQKPYAAIHVRNTDYGTNYRKLFRKIKGRVKIDRLLVCSDDPAVIEYATTYFRGDVLFFDGRQPSNDPSGTLHSYTSVDDKLARRQVVIESIIDLIALGNAKHLYLANIDGVLDFGLLRQAGRKSYKPLPMYTLSGYSILATHICKNKGIIDLLLGESTDKQRENNSGLVTIVDVRPISKRLFARAKRDIRSILTQIRMITPRIV